MRLFRRKIRGKLTKVWQVELKLPGEPPIRKSTGETDRRIAEAKAQRWQQELHEKRYKKIIDPEWIDPDSLDLISLLADWREHLESKKCTEKHIHTRIRHTILFFESLSIESPHELTTEKIRGCLANMECSQRTKLNRIRDLIGFYNWLIKTNQWNTKNPALNIDIGRIQKSRPRRALNQQEIQALIEVAPIYRRPAYLFALLAGLRRNEIDQLKLSDLDFGQKTITLRSSTTKNRKPDILPLVDKIIEPVTLWANTGYRKMKVGARGASINAIRRRHKAGMAVPAVPRVSSLRIDLQNAGIDIKNDVGIVDFHALRYTFGSQLIERGVGIEAVSRLMRHSNIHQTASTYIVLGLDKRRRDIGVLQDLID